jgi:hypothetical protein
MTALEGSLFIYLFFIWVRGSHFRYYKLDTRAASLFRYTLCAVGLALTYYQKTYLATIDLSCSLPLDNLDITVPIGMLRVSAISLYESSLR